ncbi:hypothetical protein EDB84DRAFT_1447515 [Lactarius hengduanensis]|nr:hypothetical protein EDB84DRAFT_1447515 [Lactarius hengduanensis]
MSDQPNQPRPLARKVTLRVPRPSAPDTPAVVPVRPLLLPPPPEDNLPPQALPLPPPHLSHLAAGLPNPIDNLRQYQLASPAVNGLPTHLAHLYGAALYPPGYPPAPLGPHDPPSRIPPWNYAQYPMATQPDPFLAYLLAVQRASVTDGAVSRDTHDDYMRAAETDGGVGTNLNVAAPLSVARLGKTYPNKEVSNEAWEFRTEVLNDHIKYSFTAQTDMTWPMFREEVHHLLDMPDSEVRIVFRIVLEGGGWSELASESDWESSVTRLVAKIRSARTRAVSAEVKNMHRSAHVSSKGKGKVKEKRRREDDVPPAPSPNMARQLDCLLELQQHLMCIEHSSPGKRTFCVLKESTENTSGGHEEISNQDMTLWAKRMSLGGHTTKYTLPNTENYDYPPAKKARTDRTVDITRTPGAGNSTPQATPVESTATPVVSTATPVVSTATPVESTATPVESTATPVESTATPVVSTASTSTPGPLCHAHVSDRSSRPSRLLVLLDCLGELRVPTLMELLWLMDAYKPALSLKYVDMQEEFNELGIDDSVDLYSLPVELLASFGGMGQGLARRLLEYCRDFLFYPLGFVETRGDDTTKKVSISQRLRESWDLDGDDPMTEERMDFMMEWLQERSEDEEPEIDDEIDDEGTVVDEDEEDHMGRATSYEV